MTGSVIPSRMGSTLSERTRFGAVDTSDLIRTARQQSLGDLPRRSARRHPDKTAIVDGDTRLTFAELDAAVDRAAAAMAAPAWPRATGSRCCATTAGSSRCSTSRPPGSAWSWCRSTSCSAPTRSPSSSTTAAPGVRGRGRAGADRRRRAGRGDRRVGHAAAGGPARRRRRCPTAGRTSRSGSTTTARRRRARGRRRPGPDDVHLRHRVAAQGRAPVEPVAAVAVRHLRGRRRVPPRRRRRAQPAALPLRAARRVPRPGRVDRRDQRDPARPRPGGDPRARSRSTAPTASSRRRRSGSGCCATRASTTPTSPP